MTTISYRCAVNLGEAADHLKEAAEKDVKDFMEVRCFAVQCCRPARLTG